MIDIHNMTVLITDDLTTMIKSLHNMLRVLKCGKNVFYANSGKEALRTLKNESIDLVLLDYNMPEMTGGEVVSQMREDRDLRNTPVIMITAEANREYVAEVAESEIDAYILKPLTIKVLDDKISLVVEKANNPPPMTVHLKRAMAFEEQDDIDAAVKEAELAMDAEPKSSRPVRELGYYNLKRNNLKEAEKWLLKAAEMNYLDVFSFHYLGELYLNLDDIEKAQHYFEKAMEISPRHVSRGVNFGKILVQRKMAERAIKVFEKALRLSWDNLELKEEIADFCIEEEVNNYAAKLLESIVREQPDREDLFFNLGKTLEKLGEIGRALNYLVKAEKHDKENVDIKIHMAKDYLFQKRPILAEKVLKKIFKLDPDHKEARELYKQCV